MRTQYTAQIYRGRSGDYRWRLRAGNGRIVADSAEGYHNKAHCLKMVAKLFPNTPVRFK